MPRRLGNLPLRNGDKIVLAKDGEDETKAKVTKAQKHKVVAKGPRGSATITLGSEDGEVVFRIDVEEKDEQGRVALRDDAR